MPVSAPLRVAQCCHTCRHFDGDTGYTVGWCLVGIAEVERAQPDDQQTALDLYCHVYTARYLVCDLWTPATAHRGLDVKYRRARRAIVERARRDIGASFDREEA